MIKLDNVSLVFQGGSVALSNVSTQISEGEFAYIIGHSRKWEILITKTFIQRIFTYKRRD